MKEILELAPAYLEVRFAVRFVACQRYVASATYCLSDEDEKEILELAPAYLEVRCNIRSRADARFRGGLVFKAHSLCVPLNSRLGDLGACASLP